MLFLSIAIIENMTEFKPEVCSLAGEQGLIEWLLKRIKVITLSLVLCMQE